MSATDPLAAPIAEMQEPWVLRARRWLVVTLGLVMGGALALLLLLGIALASAYPHLPDIKSLVDYRPKLPMRIYSADGVLLGEFGEERRSYLPITEIPKVMQNAVLAIEDSRFYQHGGVDYVGVMRAGFENLREARSQGASTITMQVARNFYLSSEKTFTRKIYEILLSLKIESVLSKEKILEVYMNQIFLGQRAYGFAAASEVYFGKPLKDISVAEAAMLAGLPKAPSAYNPIANPSRARVRQRHIIERMYENGFITNQQREAALAQEPKVKTAQEVPVHAEYIAETVRQLVFNQYGNATYTRGLNVHTSILSGDQSTAYRALRHSVLEYERRQFFRGPEAHVDLPHDPKIIDTRIAEALEDHPDNGELKAAVVLEASTRKVVAVLQNGENLTVSGDGLKPVASGLADKAAPNIQIRRGSIIRVLKGPKGDWTITQQPEVEGCFVAMDPKTGDIRALVGGFDYNKNKFNHVLQAWRQPGSSFKPFIYSAALEKGFTPSTVIDDAPLFFDAGTTGSQPWEPKNYDGKFEGPMPLRKGLAKSKNMISIRVLNAIGPKYAQGWVSRFGFDPEKHPAYLTMALGAGSVTPMQMAVAYSVFANGGYRVNPSLITHITDSSGRPILQTKSHPLNESMRAIEPRNAFLMTSLLQEVTRSGTAARAQAMLKRPDIYGKTGTTNDSMDAWFAGYNPNLTAVVWIGYDTPKKLGDKETGGGLALPVWIDYMSYALRSIPIREPEPPEGIVNLGNEWYFEEFTHSHHAPLAEEGTAADSPGIPAVPPAEERKGLLDLFKTN